MASYDDIINKWQQYGPNSGVTREQYDSAIEERRKISNAAVEEADAIRKQYEEDTANTIANMKKEQTLLSNANGLSSNGSLDNTPVFNTGGGVTASSRLMLGGSTTKKRRGSDSVSASLGL